jgi:hypothetical protein
VCKGAIYTDLTSAVSGSGIADGVDAGLFKTVFFGVLFKSKKTPHEKAIFACPFVFNSPASAEVIILLYPNEQ